MAAIAAFVAGSIRLLANPTTKKRLSCAPFRLRALLGLNVARHDSTRNCDVFMCSRAFQLQKL